MQVEAAESLALQALAFLAADERRLGALLAQAGWTLAELRDAAQEAHVLAGILDFLMSHEPFLLAFSAESGHGPELIAKARRALPGRPLD
jgi:hypothetical protein